MAINANKMYNVKNRSASMVVYRLPGDGYPQRVCAR